MNNNIYNVKSKTKSSFYPSTLKFIEIFASPFKDIILLV